MIEHVQEIWMVAAHQNLPIIMAWVYQTHVLSSIKLIHR